MKISILTLAFFGLTLPAFSQGVDPLIGTWKLNLEKFMASSPIPKSQTLTWSGEGQNLINTSEGIDAQGQPFKIIYRHIYDGQPYPTTGNQNYDLTLFSRIGNTVNAIRFKNEKTVEVAQFIIDPGKTYSGHAEGILPIGQSYHFYYVWDRQ